MTHIVVLTSVHQPFDVRIFHREARALHDAGHTMTLVAPADFTREEREGVAVVGVPKPRRRWQRPLVWLRLLRAVRRLRPDVLHFHDPELLLLVPWFRLLWGRRVKIVYDIHEYFVAAIASKHWLPRRLRPAIARIACALEHGLVRQVDGLVLAVEGQRPLYAHFRGQVAVVRNLPAAALFADAQPHSALNVAGLRLIYVGLLLPQRGIQTLLEAMRLLREQGVEDVRLFLIGPETSAAYMHEVQQFIEAHGLQAQVTWLGPIPHDQLKHYLSNADVGLIPGQLTAQYTRPALSTKLFEYLLCGLPIIAVDYNYTRPYLEAAQCGFIVENTPAAFAEAILRLRADRDGARAMGLRGREMVLARYVWENERHQLLEFYTHLLEHTL